MKSTSPGCSEEVWFLQVHPPLGRLPHWQVSVYLAFSTAAWEQVHCPAGLALQEQRASWAHSQVAEGPLQQAILFLVVQVFVNENYWEIYCIYINCIWRRTHNPAHTSMPYTSNSIGHKYTHYYRGIVLPLMECLWLVSYYNENDIDYD